MTKPRFREPIRSPTGEGEVADPLTDLAEALTALGNYVSAAHCMVTETGSGTQQLLVEALQKALEQHQRSAKALLSSRKQPPAAPTPHRSSGGAAETKRASGGPSNPLAWP